MKEEYFKLFDQIKLQSGETMETEDLFRYSFITFWFGLPIIFVMGSFIFAWVANTTLSIIQKRKVPFELTFRIVAYSLSAFVLLPIPFLGLLIFFVWFVHLVINALTLIYKIPKTQSFIAVIVSYTLFFALSYYGFQWVLALTQGMV